MSAIRKYPWEQIRLEYVMGTFNTETNMHAFPTQVSLSEKYDVPVTQLQVRSTTERWSRLRQEFQDKCYNEALARGVEKRSLQINEFDFMCERTAGIAIGFIFKQLTEVEDDSEKERLIVKYAKPLLDYQKAGRLALSLPTEISGQDILQIKKEIDANTDNMSVDELRKQLKSINKES